jgi:coatomer subunit beta
MKESPAHEKILQELVMDILRVLSSPDYEVRKKTLGLAMDLVTSRNIDELVLVLKKVLICSLFFFTASLDQTVHRIG